MDKYLANMGYGSRKEVNNLIKAGKVTIDGKIVLIGKTIIGPGVEVSLDDKAILYEKYTYIMMNKAKGRISASRDRRKTVLDDLDPIDRVKGLFPVGRLDMDTEGLLLISNDGRLAHKLLSPKNKIIKKYRALLSRGLFEQERVRIERGIPLEAEGIVSRPAKIEKIRDDLVEISIHEGKYHQVKRMFAFCGIEVLELKRLSMGPLVLDESLKSAEYRKLTESEKAELDKIFIDKN